MPRLPPAPLTFSTMTGSPSEARIDSVKSRAKVPTGPPGGNGTTTVTGRDGKVCASTLGQDAMRARASAARNHPLMPGLRLYTMHRPILDFGPEYANLALGLEGDEPRMDGPCVAAFDRP